MFQFDNARYNVWVTLLDPFDYNSFCTKCYQQDLTPMGAFDYAIKVGRILTAKNLYPEISIFEAYDKLAEDYPLTGNIPPKQSISTIQNVMSMSDGVEKRTSCCGGGQIK